MQADEDIFKTEQYTRLDLQRKVKINGPFAALFRVQVDLPSLTQRIRLHKMPFVVHVKTVFDGVVRIQAWDGGGYGNYILVRHYNGLETIYGHLSKALVPVGTFVKAGQLIGYGGSTGRSTGSHLHFEVRYQGNPINPTLMYDFPGYKLRKDNFTITSQLFNYYSRALTRSRTSSSSRSSGGSRSGAPSRARQTVSHKVRSGDTLSEVAEKYGVRVSTLKKLNPGVRTLQPGKKLRIK